MTKPNLNPDDTPGPDREKFPVQDPLTQLGSAATQLNEMYIIFRDQGFDPAQAIYLTAALITKHPGNPPTDGGKNSKK